MIALFYGGTTKEKRCWHNFMLRSTDELPAPWNLPQEVAFIISYAKSRSLY